MGRKTALNNHASYYYTQLFTITYNSSKLTILCKERTSTHPNQVLLSKRL